MERNLLHNGKTFIFVHPHSLWGLSITNKALFPDSGNKAFILRSVKVASIPKIRDKTRMLIALLSAISILAKWCHQESNRGHKDFQSFALPTELWHHRFCVCKDINNFIFAQHFVRYILIFFAERVPALSF